MTRRPLSAVAAVASLSSLALLVSSAEAGGIAVARFGGEHGHPMTDEPTAVYYNPAGIARSSGFNFFVDGTLAFRGIDYTAKPQQDTNVDPNYNPEPAGAEGANLGTASTFNVAAAPMAGASFSIPFEDWGIALGAAFFVPFGGSTTWDKNESLAGTPFAGADDGVQRWYAIEGTIRSMAIAGTAAVSILDHVYVGLSGNAYFSEVDTLRARNASGTNNIDAEGRSYLTASGWHGGLGAGVLVDPLPKDLPQQLLVGVSYQSQPGFGEMRLKGSLDNNFAGTPAPTDVDFIEQMPDILRFGASLRPIEELELRLFGDWTRWSVLERMCITKQGADCDVRDDGGVPDGSGVVQNLPRDWEDSFGIRAGVSYWVVPEAELYLGVGYDSNAIPDEMLDPALLDFHDISAALGGRFKLADILYLGATYTHFFYIARDTEGKATQSQFNQPSRGPDAGGDYSQWIGALNLNLQIAYDPFAADEPAEVAPETEPPPPVEPAPPPPVEPTPPAEPVAPEAPPADAATPEASSGNGPPPSDATDGEPPAAEPGAPGDDAAAPAP